MSAKLTIPELDDAIEQKLRAQANRHGQSVEAEARDILVRAVTRTDDTPVLAATPSDHQPFLDLAGCVDGTPDLSHKRGFEA